jgi:hypothetical protein
MTYLEAAIQILKASRRPLTTRELTERAIARQLIAPRGKTPEATMSATLYVGLRTNNELVKIADRGPSRAKHGSVRWTLQKARSV